MQKEKISKLLTIFMLLCCVSFTSYAQEYSPNAQQEGWHLTITGEFNFRGYLKNEIQFGRQGTLINFDKDFEFNREKDQSERRYSLSLDYNEKYLIEFTFQGFDFESRDFLTRQIIIDTTVLQIGQGIKLSLSAPLYRVSYQFTVIEPNPKFSLAAGLSLTIRDFFLSIETANDSLLRQRSYTLYIPTLKLSSTYDFKNKFWLAGEIDAIYVPVSWFTSEDDEKASYIDSKVRAGLDISQSLAFFLNIRYGTVNGVNVSKTEFGNGTRYLENRLTRVTSGVGISYRF